VLYREVANYMREQEGQGATCVLLSVALNIVGAFAIKDPLKPEAVGVVSALRNMGLQCYMVTGDNWTTARIVAAELGIINVMAEVLPAGKADKVSCHVHLLPLMVELLSAQLKSSIPCK